jgi:hypothetical protein
MSARGSAVCACGRRYFTRSGDRCSYCRKQPPVYRNTSSRSGCTREGEPRASDERIAELAALAEAGLPLFPRLRQRARE